MRCLENLISKSIVVIPTIHRPWLLALTLEKISQIPSSEHLDVRICVDTCTDERLDSVAYCRDTYFPTADIFRAGPHVQALSGNWNILHSLQMAYESGKEYCFFVEEDVFVRPTFLNWHWATQQSDDYFVTCGRRINKRLPLDMYSNPGTCYKREKLALVMPHICDEYYRDTTKYLNKHFPTMIGMDGTLDDGLIRKVQRSVNGKVLCADPPQAFHQGFHYLDKIPDFKIKGSTIQEQIQSIRLMLPAISPNNRYAPDFEPYKEVWGGQNVS